MTHQLADTLRILNASLSGLCVPPVWCSEVPLSADASQGTPCDPSFRAGRVAAEQSGFTRLQHTVQIEAVMRLSGMRGEMRHWGSGDLTMEARGHFGARTSAGFLEFTRASSVLFLPSPRSIKQSEIHYLRLSFAAGRVGHLVQSVMKALHLSWNLFPRAALLSACEHMRLQLPPKSTL